MGFLVSDAAVALMLGHLQIRFGRICDGNETEMNDDVVKTDAGRRQLQTEWNATAADYPREMCVQELFEAQVWTKTPEGLSRELCVKILKLAVCLSSVLFAVTLMSSPTAATAH